MILGALLDLGLPLDDLRAALGSLAIDYGDVSPSACCARACRRRSSRLHRDRPPTRHRHPARRRITQHHHLQAHRRGDPTHRRCRRRQDRNARGHLFERLAEAEAAIHDTPIEQVHLHEVGALDSIIDIVGAVYAFEWFGVDDVVASPLNVGGGTVRLRARRCFRCRRRRPCGCSAACRSTAAAMRQSW